MSFAESLLSGINPLGFVHVVGWALVAAAIWGAVGFFWSDEKCPYKIRSYNEGKTILGMVGTVASAMWPFAVIVIYYAAFPMLMGFVVWKGARNLRQTMRARATKQPTPKTPPRDSYEKQAEREVEEALREDTWMSAFMRKPKKTPTMYS